MPLTDDEIRALRDKAENLDRRERTLWSIAFVEIADRLLAAEARVKVLEEAIAPFSLFFKSRQHDLSPAKDHIIVASFLDQDTKMPLAELTIADFRKAAQEQSK